MDNKELNKWLAEWRGWFLWNNVWLPIKYKEMKSADIILELGLGIFQFQSVASWNPTENIAQAIECLETSNKIKYYIVGYLIKGYSSKIWTDRGNWYTGKGKTPSEAICQAIYKALKGDKQ